MATKLDILNHLIQSSKQIRDSGNTQDADMLDQKIAAIKSDPRHQDLSQPIGMPNQQTPIVPSNNQPAQPTVQQPAQAIPVAQSTPQTPQTPQTNQDTTTDLLPQNIQNYQSTSNQQSPNQTPSYGEQDVTKLIQQALGAGRALNPNLLQGIGGVISTIGGGKPYISPAQEIAQKAAEANLTMTPWKMALMNSQAQKNNALTESANASVPLKQEQAGFYRQKTRGSQTANDLVDSTLSGQGGQGQPNMQISGVSAGGMGSRVNMKNLNEIGQEKMLGAGAKGFATQDAKVNQAIHLNGLFQKAMDPKTGTYNMKQPAYNDLVQQVASLLANSGDTSEGDRKLLRQATAYSHIQDARAWLTGTPQNANTQSVINALHDIVERQGQIAQQERDQYTQNLGSNMQIGSNFNQGGQQPTQQNQSKQNDPLGIR